MLGLHIRVQRLAGKSAGRRLQWRRPCVRWRHGSTLCTGMCCVLRGGGLACASAACPSARHVGDLPIGFVFAAAFAPPDGDLRPASPAPGPTPRWLCSTAGAARPRRRVRVRMARLGGTQTRAHWQLNVKPRWAVDAVTMMMAAFPAPASPSRSESIIMMLTGKISVPAGCSTALSFELRVR